MISQVASQESQQSIKSQGMSSYSMSDMMQSLKSIRLSITSSTEARRNSGSKALGNSANSANFRVRSSSLSVATEQEETLSKDVKSVLLIGGTLGETGLECLRRLAAEDPLVFLLCPNLNRLPKRVVPFCEQAIEGNATEEADIQRAMEISQADVVVFCYGTEQEEEDGDLESEQCPSATSDSCNPQALVRVLNSTPEYASARLMVVRPNNFGKERKRGNKNLLATPLHPEFLVSLFGGIASTLNPHAKKSEDPVGAESSDSGAETLQTTVSFSSFSSILERTTIVVPTLCKCKSQKRRGSMLKRLPLPGFKNKRNKGKEEKIIVVREGSSVRLQDSIHAASGHLGEDDQINSKSSLNEMQGESLAEWLVNELLEGEHQGKIANISCARI